MYIIFDKSEGELPINKLYICISDAADLSASAFATAEVLHAFSNPLLHLILHFCTGSY